MTTCQGKFFEFIETGDKASLADCIKLVDIDLFSSKSISTLNDECRALIKSVNKDIYYVHTHDITGIIEDIKRDDKTNGTLWATKLESCLDLRVRTNTCNCINIVLYSISKLEDCDKLSYYFNNIVYTLKNIQKHLPNWILRFYMDKSVLELIKSALDSKLFNKYGKIYHNILKYICNHAQCEIYILLCPGIISGMTAIAKMRHYRFLSMLDPEVNISATRESDGIVSGIDCMNLKYLETSRTFCYFITNMDRHFIKYDLYGPNFKLIEKKNVLLIPDTVFIQSYSAWLNNYKKYSEEYYHKKFGKYRRFRLYNNMVDVLAGLTSSKCLFKKEYVDSKIEFINEVYKYINDTYPQGIMNTMNIGYDEVFLNELFSNIIDNDIFIDKDLYAATEQVELILLYCVMKTKYIGFVNEIPPKIRLPNVYFIDDIIDRYPVSREQLEKFAKLDTIFYLNIITNDYDISKVITDEDFIHSVKSFLFSYNIDTISNIPHMYLAHKQSMLFANFKSPALGHKLEIDTHNFDLLNEIFEINFMSVPEAIGGNIKYKNKYLKYKNKYLALKNIKK